MKKNLTLQISAELTGLRLDKALASLAEIATRSRASLLIEDGRVLFNGQKMKPSRIVELGEVFQIDLPAAAVTGIQPYDFDLDIEYEDDDLLVLNKPAGLVVHPAAGHQQDTLVNALVAKAKNLSMGFGEARPGIVHRLDKETSGLLVIAKNDFAHESLTTQFHERTTHRIYEAVAVGLVQPRNSTIQSWLARHPTDRKKYASVRDSRRQILRHREPPPAVGKWAVTHYQTLHQKHHLSLVQVRLETGRTHQIRVHLSEAGFPLAGDETYGATKRLAAVESVKIRQQVQNLERFLLHAKELGFTHPRTEKRLQFSRDWPQVDLERLRAWGLRD